MITLILPGWSVKNKEWLEETAMSIKVDGFIRPIFWEHWTNPDSKFNAKEKATLITKHTNGEKVNIIAKSIGSLVAAHVIGQISRQINKVVICGIPLNDISASDKEIIKRAFVSLNPEKLICFQNIDDPHGGFAEVKEFLPSGVKLISEPRSDHHYPFYTEFNKFLKD